MIRRESASTSRSRTYTTSRHERCVCTEGRLAFILPANSHKRDVFRGEYFLLHLHFNVAYPCYTRSCTECIKNGGVSMIKWIVRLFNLCFVSGVVPKEWCEACIVPLYKGKGDKYECGSYRGISLLSVLVSCMVEC